jgi:hypothetical protein
MGWLFTPLHAIKSDLKKIAAFLSACKFGAEFSLSGISFFNQARNECRRKYIAPRS